MTGVPGTVGRPGWTLPRAPGRLKTDESSRLARIGSSPLTLHATAFFALAFFAAAHWAALVEPYQTWRALLATIIATAGGVLIALSRSLPRLPGVAARVLLLVAMTLIATTAIGIRFKLLMPGNWGTLSDRVSGGLSSVGSVTEWPYGGPNTWLRLTTLLAAPLALVIASGLAFWPRAREARGVGRGLALVLLVALYGIAVAARPFEAQALRGIGLLACLVIWLWLPRLRGREATAAVSAIGVAAIAALALTPQLASSKPWVDYRHWSWTFGREKTVGFDWRHSYGPLNWPRKGKTLLLVKSKHAQYWKAETLDRFDGRGWTTAPAHDANPSWVNGVIADNPKWITVARVTLRGLRSEVVIGPGSLRAVEGTPSAAVFRGNETALEGDDLSSGDSYTVRGYTPDPSPKQMRNAPPASPPLGYYTTITVPQAGASVSHVVHVPLYGQSYIDPRAARELRASRYARIYALAQAITAGQTNQYDIVRRIGGWLEQRYKYAENVPRRAYPLDAFLFEDKRGYCQHFSGAAALMLRMLGIPVRVASGFAPGSLDDKTHEFIVRDLDAHSWIEVWFQGIGWVPFDPTPTSAPATSQAASFTPLSEIASAARGDAKDTLSPKLRDQFLGATNGSAGGLGAGSDNGTPWGWIAAGVVAVLLVLAAVVVSILRLRRGRRPPPAPSGDADVDHLVRLLARLGLDIRPGTTLLELEKRMERLGGPEVAAYAQRLRRRRFRSESDPRPGRDERRRLRHALAAAVDAGPLSRLHLAMPENFGIRSGVLTLRRLYRSR
ncbi:MAG TPA: transglutaminase domain-containing protein [Thermoleophilaceae bacterium]|nr:transglutaminase domain-containing protein [Thermoleophilaceae bacterium]